MVVFPAPVGPTMATFCPGSTTAENPWMISFPGLYEKRTSLNSTLPRTSPTGSTSSSSDGISSWSRNPNTLSAAAAADCMRPMDDVIMSKGPLNSLT